MEKRSINDSTASIIALVGSMVASGAIGEVAGNQLMKTLAATPRVTPDQIKNIYRVAGLPEDFPTTKYPGFENAAYAPPRSAEDWLEYDPALEDARNDKDFYRKAKKTGMIVYDPKFLTAGIMGHEAGHAEIGQRKWYNPSKLNQGPLRAMSSLAGTPLSVIGGLHVARKTKSPAWGALAGGGLGLLTGLPTLINEAQASNTAMKYLDQSRHWGSTKEKSKKGLRQAYDSYLLAAGLMPALAGGGYGLYQKLKNR